PRTTTTLSRRWRGFARPLFFGVEFGGEAASRFLTELPPRADGRLVVVHERVLENVEAFLDGAQRLEERTAVIAKNRRPEPGVRGSPACAAAIGAGGQRKPLDRNGRREGRGNRVGQVARIGEDFVVLGGPQLEDSAAEGRPEPQGAVDAVEPRPQR